MAEPASSAEAGEASTLRGTSHRSDFTLVMQEEGQGHQAEADLPLSLAPRLSTLGGMTVRGNLTVAQENRQIQNFYKPTVINAQNVDCNSGNGNDQVPAQSREEIHLDESLFVQTNVFKDSLDFIQEKGIAILTGPKGSGKSLIARAFLRYFENQDCCPLVIKTFEEWRKHVGGHKGTLAILLENIFGEEQYSQSEFNKWSSSIPLMQSYASKGKCYVVLTMRKEVIDKLMEALEDDHISKISIFDLASSSFTESEKEEMLKRHMEANGKLLPDTELKEILANDRSGPCFPSQCKQIARDYNSGDQASAAPFKHTGHVPGPARPSVSAACSGADSHAVSPAWKLSGELSRNRAPSESPSPGDPRSNRVHKIATLRLFRVKWPIKARVIKKTEIRKCSESRGEGRMFSVTFMDASGEIQATGFGDAVDRFFHVLEVNSVYYVSHCSTKMTTKPYSKLNTHCELHFTKKTIVDMCEDDTDIPSMSSSFVPISDLANHGANAFVDVVGVVKVCGDPFMVKTRYGRKKKRDLQIVDQSGEAIFLTLWENEAENFDGSNHPVIAVKDARLSDFRGQSLSVLPSSQLEINPDGKEAHELRQWYDREGISMDFIPHSEVWMTCQEMLSKKLVKGEIVYYSIKAMMTGMQGEDLFYQACPTESCNKKVEDLNNGRYRCENCSREFPNFKLRMVVHLKISDFSGHLWVSSFQESLESLLNVRAEELEDMRRNNEMAFDQVFKRGLLKEYIFRLRSKMVNFQGESRLDTVCLSATPV